MPVVTFLFLSCFVVLAQSSCSINIKGCVNSQDCSSQGSCLNRVCDCFAGFTGSSCQFQQQVDLAPNFVDNGNFSCHLVLDNKVKMCWNFITMGDIEAIDIGLKYKNTQDGWVAFGIGKTMKGADYAFASLKGEVTDRYSEDRQEPDIDGEVGGSDNILASSINIIDGNAYVRFIRPICAVDDDLDRSISTGVTDVILAYNVGGEDDIHDNWSHVSVDFQAGKLWLRYENTMTVHAVLLSVAWCLLISPAVLLPRFFKHIGHKWFLLHRGITIAGVVLALIGIFIGLTDSSLTQEGVSLTTSLSSHRLNHIKIGIATTILMGINPIIGFIADKMWNPERLGVPLLPDGLHIFFGYSACILAVCNIYIGINFFSKDGDEARDFNIVLSAFVVVFVLFFIYLQAKVFREPHKKIDDMTNNKITYNH